MALQRHKGAAEVFYGPLVKTAKQKPESPLRRLWTKRREGDDADPILAEAEAKAKLVTDNICLQRENAELKALLAATGTAAIIENRAFTTVAGEYQAWGELQGGRGGRSWSRDHARHRREHLTWWATKFKMLGDIKLSAVESNLHDLMTGRSNKTVSQYKEAICALCDWSKKRNYLTADPLANIGKLDVTPETNRRALTVMEITALLEKCVPTRRVVYETALTTGLRANELRSLVVGDLDHEHCGLRLHKAWTKNRKPGFQVIPRWLADKLALLTKGQDPSALLLVAMPQDTSDTFEVDRRRADIKKDNGAGDDVVDFHALRTTFTTLVDGCGASAKTTQQMARHASPQLTFGRYAKARAAELSETAEAIGRIVKIG